MSPDMILHKYTAVYKLVSSLQEIIEVGRAERTYPKWSDDFLKFCEATATATIERLKSWSENNIEDPLLLPILSWRLSTIIHGWELLHSFIKPVLDADNLKVPYSLVHFLTEHVGKLKAVSEAKFVIEISPELNYFQHPHSDLRNAVMFLKELIQGPEIEPKLGFIALPCSQSRSLFMNCLLYHEVGHFIAEEAGLLAPSEYTQLSNELKHKFNHYHDWAASTILQLMEELFADIVAVRLIGVAYTLSYMELIRLVRENISQEAKRFFVDHPCDALRFREQLKILKDDKWDSYGRRLPQWDELKQISKLPESQYLVPKEYENDAAIAQIWKMLIGFLCNKDRLRKIHTRVDALLSDRENPREHFEESADEIKECLGHGIVPSSRKADSIPHPVAIINGAVLFWLSEMKGLFDTVPSRHDEKIEDRAFLENRVEIWCLKGIEDWLIRRS